MPGLDERRLVLLEATCYPAGAGRDAGAGHPTVVRRGVTITSTAEKLTEKDLSALPFSIKETKLIHHGSGFAQRDERHPLNMIATTIMDGWRELQSRTRL